MNTTIWQVGGGACLVALALAMGAAGQPRKANPNDTLGRALEDGRKASGQEPVDPGAVLDDFHDAAAKADLKRYFGHFAKAGVFLGTDATERWTVEEFRAYAKPHFDQGHGWTYVPRKEKRHLSPQGDCVWFDEALDNEKYGECRGTGVLVKEDGEWKIGQYSLSVPIPNDLLPKVAEMVRMEPTKSAKPAKGGK